ncbi:uncharacterized protein LOC127835409 [Dreissena polymorpha]|uniref:Opioid growth factor receptor (OGFr) conserved domain-containing protein n=1 Tax=Dreissena polymorpha TaxID=45954 RepID=A0A9D4MWK0_DREPO|nr:uncharacterized protein LOC127835409 [Dreissena polymorpha]KAH3883866.1 hypothetical protein DPMN_007834 [Dreissena polymorpha]
MRRLMMGQLFSDENEPEDANLKFYRNIKKSRPWPGTKINKMLRWKGDYDQLEADHEYIQWLFPLPERSNSNSSSQPLYEEEAKAIREDAELKKRVAGAYDMMLDFYGFQLVDSGDGTLARRHNYRERLEHLNRSKHNYRRITRIIRSLGELGFDHYQAKFVLRLMEEAIVWKTIPKCARGPMMHWVNSIKDDSARAEVGMRYRELNSGQDYTMPEKQVEVKNANLKFYRNEIHSRPYPGACIEEMLTWKGDYRKLENDHAYIQWLFPIPEASQSNSSAKPLRENEAKAIREDEVMRSRVYRAYDMMVDFYGFKIADEVNGELHRHQFWHERLQNLNRSSHNYRRITRILRSLGDLGFERFQASLVKKLIEEAIVHCTVFNALPGSMDIWIDMIKDQFERADVRKMYTALTSDPHSETLNPNGETPID